MGTIMGCTMNNRLTKPVSVALLNIYELNKNKSESYSWMHLINVLGF